MSLWKRVRQRARRIVERFTEPAPPEEPRESPRAPATPDYTGGGGGASTPDSSRLPPGWVVAGLYHQGEKTRRISATGDTEVTDNEIHGADAIIVHYVAGGEDGYKWIHGATGWDSIYDQIERTVKIVSPKGTGE